MTLLNRSAELGIATGGLHTVNAVRLYERITDLARAQSRDITARIAAENIKVIQGHGRLDGPGTRTSQATRPIKADAILVATGALPRVLPGAEPDGERILTWRQLYDLTELPRDLIVVGSGVTGAEFASAYQALGSRVTLVSSRDRVLPQEDEDAANLIEDVFRRSGMQVLGQSRAQAVSRDPDGVTVTLADGRTVSGSHCLMTVGMVPRTEGSAWTRPGSPWTSTASSRSTACPGPRCPGCTRPGTAPACSCWPRWPPCRAGSRCGTRWASRCTRSGSATWPRPSSPTRRSPPSASRSGRSTRARSWRARQTLPLATNPRAKMAGFREGFVKLFTSPGTGVILGGVIVAPRASELILAVSVAMEQRLTAEQLAQTFTVYPSLSGSVTETARR